LAAGEFAYSYQSNTLFLGSPAGTGVVNVGGQYYTSQVDNATDASTGGTLVRRDANGNAAFGYITATNIAGSVSGNANSATQFQTDRFINISGGDITASAQLFNGTANATLSASLTAVAGLTAGVYGGSTTVPIVTVAANGRIMSIANSAAISTSIGIAGDTGTDTVSLATDTLTFAGGAGLTSTVTDNTVTLDVDNTVVRSNTASLNQIIDGNVQISGNLSVLGTQTVINTSVLEVKDPLIYLGGNNYVSDIVDIGFVGNYNSGAANLRSGLIRHAGTKEFYAFDSYTGNIDNNSIDVTSGGFNTANLVLNVAKANVIGNYVRTSSVTAPTGNLSVGPAANATVFYSTGNVTVPGKITANGIDLQEYIASAFSASNSAVTSASTLAIGGILVGAGGNTVATLANSTYTLTGTLGAAKTITSLTVDAYGRVTAATAADISGLTVAQGGTGAATFSNGGLLVGSGTGANVRVVLPPQSGHGFNPAKELDGSNVMVSERIGQVDASENGLISTSTSIRQYGLLRDPYKYGANTVVSAANANTVISQTVNLTLVAGSPFTLDEFVYQGGAANNAYFYGFVNSQSSNEVRLIKVRGDVAVGGTLIGATSGVVRTVVRRYDPEFEPYTGDIEYVENVTKIQRADGQAENIKFVIRF
jgi:hypothetical protein